ncbi:MAG: class I SAM-dependent methyltransferase [Alphaproteobacteria bacterium]
MPRSDFPLVPKKPWKTIRRLATRSRRMLEIDNKPVPRVRYGWDAPGNPWIERILAHHDERQLRFVDAMAAHRDDFGRVAIEPPEDTQSTEPYWRNPCIPPLDAMALYTVLADNRPATYLEIGSGHSTQFARRAISDHGLTTRIVSIDPKPRAEIDAISDTNHRTRLEDVDLTVFDGLGRNDVVFIDGSHRCFQNSDVTVFFLEVLPRLDAGVMVGVHDIFWPNDYPAEWLGHYYSEQYVLGAYLIGRGTSLPITFCSAYAMLRFEARIQAAVPNGVEVAGGGIFLFATLG